MHVGVHEFVVKQVKLMFIFKKLNNGQIFEKIILGLKSKCLIITPNNNMIVETTFLNSWMTTHVESEEQ